MNKLIKLVFSYFFIIGIGGSIGYGSIRGYQWVTEPASVVVGDYSEHFAMTERQVIMYGTNWCPVCENTREYFNGKGIDFVEFNPENDIGKNKMYQTLDANGYPVIIIGNKRIFGLNKEEIEAALTENLLL